MWALTCDAFAFTELVNRLSTHREASRACNSGRARCGGRHECEKWRAAWRQRPCRGRGRLEDRARGAERLRRNKTTVYRRHPSFLLEKSRRRNEATTTPARLHVAADKIDIELNKNTKITHCSHKMNVLGVECVAFCKNILILLNGISCGAS